MDIVKRNYTTVNNWVKTMKSMCGLNIRFKICVYNTLSFNLNDCCFEVVMSLENIEAHFGEYFIYYVTTDKYGYVTTDKYGEAGISCLKLLACKNRPDEKYWSNIYV